MSTCLSKSIKYNKSVSAFRSQSLWMTGFWAALWAGILQRDFEERECRLNWKYFAFGKVQSIIFRLIKTYWGKSIKSHCRLWSAICPHKKEDHPAKLYISRLFSFIDPSKKERPCCTILYFYMSTILALAVCID